MPKFEIQGIIERIDERGSSILAKGGCVKEANSAAELKAAWERDMRLVFGSIGPDYNIEFHSTVRQVPDDTLPEKYTFT